MANQQVYVSNHKLGHHAAAFTMDTYGGVTQKMRERATDKINDFLSSYARKGEEIEV